VLFINADREYFEGRAQNHLLPEHIEKIVNTFESFAEVPGFSAIVSNATLRDNDYNLNIRRYADNAPPPEPHDVRAHLLGGVPKAEVAGQGSAVRAHGLDPLALFVERDASYYDFRPEIATASRSSPRSNPTRACWPRAGPARQPSMPGGRRTARASPHWPARPASWACATSCCTASAPRWSRGVLGRFQVRGIVAGFWSDAKYEFLTLMARGAKGVVDAWRTSILTALDDEQAKDNPLDHKLVRS
jgi:type I restriction enzyme M protein